MARLFISLYLFIAISLVGLSAFLKSILFDSKDLHSESYHQQFLQTAINMNMDIPQVIDDLGLESRFLSKADMALPQPNITTSTQGKIITLTDPVKGLQLYINRPDNMLLEVTIPSEQTSNQQYFVYTIIFFLSLGGLIALWIWPLWRDLTRLQHTVSGLMPAGNSQPNDIGKRSLIFPIAQAINQMQNRISELMQNQRELTSAVAHEFRTPLARLKFALAMQQSIPNTLKLDIQQDINELEKLVQEMLDYASTDIRQPELNLAEIPVVALCEKVIAQIKPTYLSNISVELHGKSNYLLADEHFIQRALSNVLINAGRYAKHQVVVSVSHTSEDMRISVEDDGQGIAQDMRDKIFTPFFRPDESRNRRQGGAGLGLAIVKRIMNWHQGRVYVTTSSIGGASFVLVFPSTSIIPNRKSNCSSQTD